MKYTIETHKKPIATPQPLHNQTAAKSVARALSIKSTEPIFATESDEHGITQYWQYRNGKLAFHKVNRAALKKNKLKKVSKRLMKDFAATHKKLAAV